MKKLLYLSFLITVFVSCAKQPALNDLAQILERGQIRAVTLESATSYYTVGDDAMGFDFALAQNLADHLGLELKIVVASSEQQLKEILKTDKADFAAYHLPTTKTIADNFLTTKVETLSHIVLVQPVNRKPLTNVAQLIDKEVYVQRNTKYHTRLRYLNEEIGGGINIKYLSDTLQVEAIIHQVATGKIPFTVVDSDVAMLAKKHFKNINIDMPVSIPLPKAWIVRKNAPALDSAINDWYSNIVQSKYVRMAKARNLSKSRYFDNFEISVPKGNISPYDSIFKKKAHIIGRDWRLLAALAYHESRFNPNTISPNGAMGIMQIMHRTGLKFGLTDSTFFEPEHNIEAGAKLIASLDKMFSFVKDENERIKLVLAAYNSGQGHILDAVNLTKKYKGNPQLWKDNVEKYLLLKSDARYYNDEVVKLGYYRANHTVKFVYNVLATYDKYMGITRKE